MLSEKQQQKLDNLQAKDVSEKVRKELLNVWKIYRGNEATKNFQYEYDELFDEYDKVCEVSLDEFKNIAPTIYKRIGGTAGSKIFNGITKGKFTVGLTKKENVDASIEKIKNSGISEKKKAEQIEKRELMFEEGQALKKKGVKLTKNLAWKIWFIEEGIRTVEFVNEEKLEKNLLKVEYLGSKFMKELKSIEYPEDDD